MKLDTLPANRAGILAFNGTILVRFNDDGESFHVFNGNWSGTYDGKSILIHKTMAVIPSKVFEQVLEITDLERTMYYFAGNVTLKGER